MVYIIKKVVYFLICKVIFKVKFINKDKEKNIGRCVVCANHFSYAEPVILFSAIPELAIMSKAELFKNKIIGKIFLYIGMFPINRGEKDVKSLLHAVNALKHEKYNKLLIFPEGTTVRKNANIQAKTGAVYIALKADVPILPVRVIANKSFTKMKVIYGDPIYLDSSKRKDKEYLRQESDKLMEVIYNLIEN